MKEAAHKVACRSRKKQQKKVTRWWSDKVKEVNKEEKRVVKEANEEELVRCGKKLQKSS